MAKNVQILLSSYRLDSKLENSINPKEKILMEKSFNLIITWKTNRIIMPSLLRGRKIPIVSTLIKVHKDNFLFASDFFITLKNLGAKRKFCKINNSNKQ